jgi:hypothetical protein
MNFTIQAEAPARKEKTVEEVTTLGKKVAEGEEYFAVAHIFASFNDTFVVSYFFVLCSALFISAEIIAISESS